MARNSKHDKADTKPQDAAGKKYGEKSSSRPRNAKTYGKKVQREAEQRGERGAKGTNQYDAPAETMGKTAKKRLKEEMQAEATSVVKSSSQSNEATGRTSVGEQNSPTSLDEMIGLPGAKPNRVILAIQKCRDHIRQRILDNKLTPAMAEQTRKNLDMEIVEYCTFQELKSLAASQGYLTVEEAQTVYAYLGESPSTFNDQPLGVKIVLTQLAAELLSWRVKAGGLQKI
jgi:hypothetical protein